MITKCHIMHRQRPWETFGDSCTKLAQTTWMSSCIISQRNCRRVDRLAPVKLNYDTT